MICMQSQLLDARCQQILQQCADDIEGEEEYRGHDEDENGNRGVFSHEDTVDLLAADMLL